MTTNILKKLSLSVLPTSLGMSPEQHRRTKLIGKLMEQKAIAEADRDGLEPNIMQRRWVTTENGGRTAINAPKRIKRWWVQDVTGNWLLAIHYGSKVIEIEKGKTAIVVGNPDQLVPTIETVIAAINAGELDGHLAQMGLSRPLKKTAK